MKKKFFFVLILVIVFVSFLMIVKIKNKNDRVKNENNKITVSTRHSWMIGYASIYDITKASDLIAIIQVKNTNGTDGDSNISFLTYDAEIIDSIYGCKDGDVISIYATANMEEDPIPEPEQEFLVFTKKNEDGTYTILGGPQGRMKYQDGKLTSQLVINEQKNQVRYNQQNNHEDQDSSNVEEHSQIELEVDNEDAETIINKIKGAIEN